MFPVNVKQSVMISCGRCCCLCHKFCGTLMECHHIVQNSKGGQNTFENCIPLCLDCHAIVGHYNEEHPKGIKFTPDELRSHRDKWYKKVELRHSSGAPQNYLELDKRFFEKLFVSLGGSKKMLHFRDHDYYSHYPIEVDHRLYAFLDVIELPESQFFDFEMDSALATLRDAINEYFESALYKIQHYDNRFAGIIGKVDFCDLSSELNYRETVKIINKKATAIWEAYYQFIQIGRRCLKIEINNDIRPASEK